MTRQDAIEAIDGLRLEKGGGGNDGDGGVIWAECPECGAEAEECGNVACEGCEDGQMPFIPVDMVDEGPDAPEA